MKTILYATDYSDNSVSALHYACDLSEKLKANLIVLHVFDTPSFSGTYMLRPLKQIEKNAYEEQLAVLNTYCKKNIGEKLNRINVQMEVIHNVSILKGIMKKTKELDVDLVIIGMKDKHSNRGFLMGDIAKSLLTKISCPTLVVPNKSNIQTIKNIVYATDFESDDILAIENLISLALPFLAKIHIIHISSKEEYKGKDQMLWFKDLLKQKVDYKHLEFEFIISDSIFEELTSYLDKVNANLIVMLERDERSFLKKIFHKDLVKRVESQTEIPLLSFNAKKEISTYF